MDTIVFAGLSVGSKFLNLLLNIPQINIKGVFVIDEKYKGKTCDFQLFDDFEKKVPLFKIDRINRYYNEIEQLKPDIIFSVGWSQIVSSKILDIPKKGVVGFHYAKLPERRGGSPVTWALIDGLKETYVSMFYYTPEIDAGDIIAEMKIEIGINDTSLVLLKKIEHALLELSKIYIPKLIYDLAPRKKQDGRKANYTKRRSEKDDEIKLNEVDPLQIHNYIRALHYPYPGVYVRYKGYKIYFRDSYVVKEKK